VGGAEARAGAREEGAWRYEVERPEGGLLNHGSSTYRGGGAGTPTNNPLFDIHRGAHASLTPPTQKSAVLCTQPPAGSTTQRKLATPDSPKRLQRQHTHTSATRHPRLPTLPQHTLTFCAPHAHPLLPTAMAFVSYGLVLVISSKEEANKVGV
jgi:hypothetical protein